MTSSKRPGSARAAEMDGTAAGREIRRQARATVERALIADGVIPAPHPFAELSKQDPEAFDENSLRYYHPEMVDRREAVYQAALQEKRK